MRRALSRGCAPLVPSDDAPLTLHSLNRQYKPPYALVQLDKAKYSTPGKVYDVTLELTVPVNPNNLDLGNFMCSLSLLDATGEHLVTASRPAILAHPSASAQACLAPSSSKHSSTLSRLLLFPLTLVTRSTSTAASCLAPLASSSWTPGPGCTTKLVIPLLERASFASPALSSSALTARKPSRWTLGRGYKARRAASNGPATALWVQVGREDAHPSPDEAKTALKRGEEVEQAEGRTETRVSRRERERERPRELQVQEAWVRIEVQLHGLRCVPLALLNATVANVGPAAPALVRAVRLSPPPGRELTHTAPARSAFAYHHPYLLFATFVPSFLALELFAALAAYVLCVVRAEPATPEEQDLVQRLSGRREGAKPRGASPSGRARTPQTELSTPFEFETDVEAEAARLRAARRMRLGPGGVGMSEAFTASGGPSGGETGTGTEYTDEDGEEGTEVGESVSEVGVGEVRGRVKDEEDEGDAGTVAGVRVFPSFHRPLPSYLCATSCLLSGRRTDAPTPAVHLAPRAPRPAPRAALLVPPSEARRSPPRRGPPLLSAAPRRARGCAGALREGRGPPRRRRSSLVRELSNCSVRLRSSWLLRVIRAPPCATTGPVATEMVDARARVDAGSRSAVALPLAFAWSCAQSPHSSTSLALITHASIWQRWPLYEAARHFETSPHPPRLTPCSRSSSPALLL